MGARVRHQSPLKLAYLAARKALDFATWRFEVAHRHAYGWRRDPSLPPYGATDEIRAANVALAESARAALVGAHRAADEALATWRGAERG